MKKAILGTTVVALLSAGSVSAEGLTGGLEVDYKSQAKESRDVQKDNSGAKLFMNYNNVGLSAKTNIKGVNEYNLNYTHKLNDSNVFVRGEYELVDKTDNLPNTNKFGLTVGTTFADTINTSFRFRKDLDEKASAMGKQSDISRVDFALGNQFENVHFNTKIVGQHQHNKASLGAGADDQIFNYEARMTFNGISDVFIPYVELSNEANFQNKNRETFSKVGVVFKF